MRAEFTRAAVHGLPRRRLRSMLRVWKRRFQLRRLRIVPMVPQYQVWAAINPTGFNFDVFAPNAINEMTSVTLATAPMIQEGVPPVIAFAAGHQAHLDLTQDDPQYDAQPQFVRELAPEARAIVRNGGASRTPGGGPRQDLVERLRMRQRSIELAPEAATGSPRIREGLGGARAERSLGRRLEPSPDPDFDFVADGIGNIELKGPFLTNDLRPLGAHFTERQLQRTVSSVATRLHPSSAAGLLVLDLHGLSSSQASRLVGAIQETVPAAHLERLLVLQ
jgi:hypothetical protein